MADNWSPWTLAGVIVRVSHAVRHGQRAAERIAMCGMPMTANMRRTPGQRVNCTGCREALSR